MSRLYVIATFFLFLLNAKLHISPHKKINLLQTRFAGNLVDEDDAHYELITYDMISESFFFLGSYFCLMNFGVVHK